MFLGWKSIFIIALFFLLLLIIINKDIYGPKLRRAVFFGLSFQPICGWNVNMNAFLETAARAWVSMHLHKRRALSKKRIFWVGMPHEIFFSFVNWAFLIVE